MSKVPVLGLKVSGIRIYVDGYGCGCEYWVDMFVLGGGG